ncbi:mCG9020, partial [Mus musculus]
CPAMPGLQGSLRYHQPVTRMTGAKSPSLLQGWWPEKIVGTKAQGLYLPSFLSLVATYLTMTFHDLSFVPGYTISVHSWNSCQEYTRGPTAHQN